MNIRSHTLTCQSTALLHCIKSKQASEISFLQNFIVLHSYTSPRTSSLMPITWKELHSSKQAAPTFTDTGRHCELGSSDSPLVQKAVAVTKMYTGGKLLSFTTYGTKRFTCSECLLVFWTNTPKCAGKGAGALAHRGAHSNERAALCELYIS